MTKKRNYPLTLFQIVFRGGKGLATAAVLLKIISGILPALYIAVYSYFIETLLRHFEDEAGDSKAIFIVAVAFVGIGIINFFSSGISTYITSKLQLHMTKKIRLDNIDKISRLEYTHIENDTSYDTMARVRKGTPGTFLEGFFAYLNLVELALKILSIAGSVLLLSPWMAVLMIICCIPIVWISLRSGKEDYEAFVAYQKIERRIEDYEKVLTSKQYAQERTVYGYGNWLTQRWHKQYQQATDIFLKVKKKMYVQVKTTSGLVILSFLAMIGGLAYETVMGVVPIGKFTSVTNELLVMSSTISWTLSSMIHTISKCHTFLQDYDAFLNLSEEQRKLQGKADGSTTEIKSIEFRNVSFCYPGNQTDTLHNVNFYLDSQNTYALVGENGAGKTTITKLLLGLYSNYTGKILINGMDLKDNPELSQLFSVSFQDFAKYEISVRDNIVFGNRKGMSDKQILERMSMLSFQTERLDAGLDTEIGYLTESTTNLSLGEWQKLSLLRALACQGGYYLLDEPTASLDPSAEAAIYTDFMKIVNESPALIITHRLGAARLADKVLVLENGAVAECGNHEELIARRGLYYKMYEAQKGWYI